MTGISALVAACRGRAEILSKIPTPEKVPPTKPPTTPTKESQVVKPTPEIEPEATPTPDRRFREPQVSDIKIEREFFSRCAPYEKDPTGNDMWGGWIVKLDSSRYYLRGGKFELELLTPSGGLIAREPIVEIKLASGTLDYIPAFTEVPPKFQLLGAGRFNYFVSGEGSQLGGVRLRMTGPMEWALLDDSVKEYKWEGFFDGVGYSTGFYIYPQGKERRAPRNFWVEVRNTGERALEKVGVFGFMTNSEGQLVDILMGNASQIPYGTSQRIEARSLSETGRCAGFSVDGELIYWVHFETYTGMPIIIKHEIIKVPGSW